MDANGTKLWDKRFGGDSDDWASSITETSSGEFLIAGKSYSGISGDKTQNSRGEDDYWIVKIDADGNKL